jgi:putative MATE family efflux protein
VEAEVVALGGRYLRILLAFNVPMAVGLVLSSGLRGAGDVRTPLAIGALMNGVNVLGHYVLVFGHWGAPRLGTDGSALATGLSFALGALLYLALWQRNDLAIERGAWLEGLTGAGLRRILRIGLPTAAEQLAWQVGLFLFLRVVAGFGTEPVAAYMIGVRILGFSFVPGLGFSTAASTLVGQHLGAGQPRLAARSGWRATVAAVGVMAAAGLAIVLLAPTVAGWFGATGADTVRLTILFIYVLGAAQPLMAVEYALGGALRGAGDTRFPLLAILAGLFGFRLGGAALVTLVFGGGVVAVWCCLLFDYAVKALLLAWRFASGRWQHVPV